MRRQEREIKEIEHKLRILDQCMVCRIAMQDDEGLYIVPVNFGYSYREQILTLYFHSAKDGRKVRALQESSRVAFEMDCSHNLIKSEEACGYGYAFESIMGNGRAELLTETEEKVKALGIFMRHQTTKEFLFTEEMCAAVNVYKIVVSDFTGKHHARQEK